LISFWIALTPTVDDTIHDWSSKKR